MTDTRSDAAGRIDGIRERAEKATPGPLEIMRYDHGGGRMGFFGDPHKGEKRKLVADFYQEADREFYYAAREDIPYLLTALQSALGRVKRLEEALTMCAVETAPSMLSFTGFESESIARGKRLQRIDAIIRTALADDGAKGETK